MESPKITNSEKENVPNNELIEFFQKEHGWIFTDPFYKQSEIPEVQEKYIEKWDIASEINILKGQLLSYVIKDSFGKNHSDRRNFLDQLEEKQGKEFIEKIQNLSKLRGANLTSSSYAMQWIIRKFEKQGDQNMVQKLKEILDLETLKNSNVYAEMDFNEKTAFAKEFDTRIYKFLEALS